MLKTTAITKIPLRFKHGVYFRYVHLVSIYFQSHTYVERPSEGDCTRIGVGALLFLGISKCPTNIGRYLCQSFNYKTRSFVLEDGTFVPIDEEDVEPVLDLPHVKEEIIEAITGGKGVPLEYPPFVLSWKRIWGFEDSSTPYTVQMISRILDNTDDDFKVDFCVFLVSSFLRSLQNCSCRSSILYH